MKDIHGQDINPGDWISYPWRASSSMGFNHSQVDTIEQRPNRYALPGTRTVICATTLAGKRVTIERTDLVVKAPRGWTPDPEKDDL